MTSVQQLPRIVMTWGLMFLTVIAGGVRPSCICADGTLCLLCPKLLAATSVSSKPRLAATGGSCSSKSCCRERASAPTQPKSTSVCESVGSTCDGGGCLTIQAAPPVILQDNDDPTSRLGSDVVSATLATTTTLTVARESFHPTSGTHRAGPPPDLIVLYQRWRI